MFSNAGKYEPCGIFTLDHFILIFATIIGIIISLKNTSNKNKEEVYKIIRNSTILLWILEIIKMIFNIKQNSFRKIHTYLPLYYCSMLLYAGLLSSFAKGTLKRIGDVSLSTGSIIGGIIFIIYPSTSLPNYPAFHYLSLYSFLYHGTMVYLGILMNKIRYIELNKKDIKYFAVLVFTMSIIALIINTIFDENLMFISNNFPGTPIEILYKITNGGFLFTLINIALQMTLPFYISFYTIKYMQYLEDKKGKVVAIEKC